MSSAGWLSISYRTLSIDLVTFFSIPKLSHPPLEPIETFKSAP